MNKTIPALFQNSIAKYPKNVALWEKKSAVYEPTDYKQLGKKVENLALAFHGFGIQKGDRVSLISEGRNDWIICEMALFHLGCINVPLSIKIIEPTELAFKISHSQSRIVICSGGQLEKVRNVKDELSQVEKIIVLDKPTELLDKEITLEQFLRDYPPRNHADFENLWQNVNEKDCATISYTSGTTAAPKGIMLSHRNYTANVEQAERMFTIPEWYKTLLILPWDHSFAHTVGIFPLLKNGAAIASVQAGKTGNETLRNIPINIKETQPSFILSVPALAKNFKKNIETSIKAKGAFTWKLFRFALGQSYKYNRLGFDRGKGLNILRKPLVNLFQKILFSKINDGFGGRLQFFVGGGALLDLELQKFFSAIGIPMYQGYGLTEAAPIISSNSPRHHKFGSSGKIAPGIICKILDEDGNEMPANQKGEIVVKGENVMLGYWHNPEATAEAIVDEWLHTGDMGYLDSDGYLYVLGRFKSLLISEDGEKYSPEGIEEAIIEKSEFINQIVLYNDHRPYTVACIVPDYDKLRKAGRQSAEELIELIQNELRAFYKDGSYAGEFPERWLPSSFCLLEEAFTEQNGLMNSTMKIVRPRIYERYDQLLNDLYTAEGKKKTHTNNIKCIQNKVLS